MSELIPSLGRPSLFLPALPIRARHEARKTNRRQARRSPQPASGAAIAAAVLLSSSARARAPHESGYRNSFWSAVLNFRALHEFAPA